MVKIERLVRPNIKMLKPYASARDEFKGSAEIYLDANENAFGTPVEKQQWHRYPDPQQRQLKQAIGKWLNLDPEWVFLGNGSDEVIDLVMRVFAQPKRDAILIMPPTYGMYKVTAQINDLQVVEAPLTPDFQIDHQTVQTKLHQRVKILFICSPNNPTANAFPLKEITKLVNMFKGIVVVDEAYIDFSPQKTALPLIFQFNHVVVLRTFSKAWGSAAIRLGMALAQPELLQWLTKIKMPYNVNGLTQQVALQLLNKRFEKEQRVEQILKQRHWLEQQLNRLPIVKKVYPSDANFLLVKFQNANQTYRYLMEKGIIVRNRSNQIHCDQCLRITVGTSEENKTLIGALKQMAEN